MALPQWTKHEQLKIVVARWNRMHLLRVKRANHHHQSDLPTECTARVLMSVYNIIQDMRDKHNRRPPHNITTTTANNPLRTSTWTT